MTIELQRARLTRGRRFILDDVDLVFRLGELTALLGPNGAGKSTLLGVASGSFEPTAGQVLFNGRPLRTYTPEALAKARAVLAQLSGLEFSFSVREVVALGRYPHGDADAPAGRAAVERAIAALDLEPLAQSLYTTLSGGERQRTHAARALAQVDLPADAGPAWLLLDEPTSALDLVHQHRLMGHVRAFVARGNGAVAVLHDPNLAAQYADRVVLLSGGRVKAEGEVRAVLSSEQLTPVFGVPIDVVTLPGRAYPVVIARGPVAGPPCR